VPTIADPIPSEIFPRELINIPSNIKLADPEFHLPRFVDLLIGSGSTLALFSIDQINFSRKDHELYLQKTRLGRVVVGSAPLKIPPRTTTCGLTNLEDQVAKFWTIEEIAMDKPQPKEEIECEEHFTRNVSRDKNGRYSQAAISQVEQAARQIEKYRAQTVKSIGMQIRTQTMH